MKKSNSAAMECAPCMLMLFVDGLGLAPQGPDNPITPLRYPCLARWLEQAIPVDACLGVPGLPQSATGQTALLTGVNAAELVGRHVEGFPGPTLRACIREHNLLLSLKERGCRVAFANAYYITDMQDVRLRRLQSVTTVATLSSLGEVRGVEALHAGEAVYQDLTREALRPRGYDGPLWSPEQAAEDLMRIASGQDFTLFEYFQTDRAGHRADPERTANILSLFDRFLCALEPFVAQPGCGLVMISDHGNIEDTSVRTHTRNPVPLVAMGAGAEHLRAQVRTLTDFTPTVLHHFAD